VTSQKPISRVSLLGLARTRHSNRLIYIIITPLLHLSSTLIVPDTSDKPLRRNKLTKSSSDAAKLVKSAPETPAFHPVCVSDLGVVCIFQMSSSHHKLKYKNTGLDSQELRRRREEEGVQLRKQKREQQLSKRRNVNISAEHHIEEPSSTTTSMQVRAYLTTTFLEP
jgi:hypothetical protein